MKIGAKIIFKNSLKLCLGISLMTLSVPELQAAESGKSTSLNEVEKLVPIVAEDSEAFAESFDKALTALQHDKSFNEEEKARLAEKLEGLSESLKMGAYILREQKFPAYAMYMQMQLDLAVGTWLTKIPGVGNVPYFSALLKRATSTGGLGVVFVRVQNKKTKVMQFKTLFSHSLGGSLIVSKMGDQKNRSQLFFSVGFIVPSKLIKVWANDIMHGVTGWRASDETMSLSDLKVDTIQELLGNYGGLTGEISRKNKEAFGRKIRLQLGVYSQLDGFDENYWESFKATKDKIWNDPKLNLMSKSVQSFIPAMSSFTSALSDVFVGKYSIIQVSPFGMTFNKSEPGAELSVDVLRMGTFNGANLKDAYLSY